MYELYVENCKARNVQYVKPGLYRSVFCSEFNLSFHQQKKDQCSKCEQYENSNEEEKIKLCSYCNEHIERKNRARREKAADKEK